MTKKKKLEIESRLISDLVADPNNARRHNNKNIFAIKGSLRKFGQQKPIVIDGNGMVVAGNGTVAAAIELGWTHIDVVQTELTGREAKAFALADNRTAELAEWDDKQLAETLQELREFDFDIEAIGFDFDSDDPKEGLTDDDAIPEPPKVTKTKPGDLYQLGEHRLLCGDSTKKEDVERLMGGYKADLVFTDPPYNIASDSRNYASDVSKSMCDLKNSDWDKNFDIDPALDRIKENIAKSATVYIWTSQFLIQKIWDHLSDWCDFTGYCVWAKPNPMPSLSKRHWTWNSELCVYGTVGSKRVVNFPKEGHAPSVWTFTKKSDGTHPTQKPVELCEHVISFSSANSSLVLDLFLGSGSTLIACEKTNRKCYGMEIDPIYCDVIVKRWEDFTGKKAKLVESNG